MTGALPEGWLVLEGTSDPSPPVDRAALRAVLACVGNVMPSAKTARTPIKRARPAPKADALYAVIAAHPHIGAILERLETTEQLIKIRDFRARKEYVGVYREATKALPEDYRERVEDLTPSKREITIGQVISLRGIIREHLHFLRHTG